MKTLTLYWLLAGIDCLVTVTAESLADLRFKAHFHELFIHGKGSPFGTEHYQHVFTNQRDFCLKHKQELNVNSQQRYFGVDYGSNVDNPYSSQKDSMLDPSKQQQQQQQQHHVLYMEECFREDLYWSLRKLIKTMITHSRSKFAQVWEDDLHPQTIEWLNYTTGSNLGWHVDINGTVLTIDGGTTARQ